MGDTGDPHLTNTRSAHPGEPSAMSIGDYCVGTESPGERAVNGTRPHRDEHDIAAKTSRSPRP